MKMQQNDDGDNGNYDIIYNKNEYDNKNGNYEN